MLVYKFLVIRSSFSNLPSATNPLLNCNKFNEESCSTNKIIRHDSVDSAHIGSFS